MTAHILSLGRREALRRSEAIERGRAWLEQGADLVPLRSASKALITGFGPRSRHLTTLAELLPWMAKGCNLGVVLGGALGLVVADFETVEAWESWCATLGKATRTYTERSGRGYHVFFRAAQPAGGEPRSEGVPCHDAQSHARRSPFLKAMIPDTLEIKTDTVIAVAPSIHPSGAAYAIVSDAPILAVTVAEMEALFPFLRARRRVLEEPRAPSRTIPSSGGGLIGAIKARWSVLEEARRQGIDLQGGPVRFRARCPFHDDRSPSFWLDTTTDTWGCYASSCSVNALGVRAQDVINLRAFASGQDVRTAIRSLTRELHP